MNSVTTSETGAVGAASTTTGVHAPNATATSSTTTPAVSVSSAPTTSGGTRTTPEGPGRGQREGLLSRDRARLESEGQVPLTSVTGLRGHILNATAFGHEILEDCLGETVLQNHLFLFEAGKALAKKVSSLAGFNERKIDAVIGVDSGKFPGLCYAFTHALSETSGVQLNPDMKVLHYTWDETNFSPVLRSKSLNIIIVTAARTPDLAERMRIFTGNMRKAMSATTEPFIQVCSVVCMNSPSPDRYVNLVTIVIE